MEKTNSSCGCCGNDGHLHEEKCQDSCGCSHHKEESHKEESSCVCSHNHEEEHSHNDSGCGCGHSHSAKPENLYVLAGCIIAAVALIFAAPHTGVLSLPLFIAAYALVGGSVVINAVKGILNKELFDENFLMSVATMGAFAIGDYSEAVAVMIFYQIGELLQGFAVRRSRQNIEGLMNIRPEFATLLVNGEEKKIAPEAANIGDTIIIKAGEKIPLDCIVLTGQSAVDTSALTGESVPVDAGQDTALISGSVNLTGVITCKVTSEFKNSAVQKILDLVSQASEKKAKAEKFITKFAKIYTPVVIALAAALMFIPPIFAGNFSQWFYNGLIFLVVSCPCALVVSIPVGFMGGIGAAAKNGILVKGGNIIDSLVAPKAIVFDKTGTLTMGSFAVEQILPASGADNQQLMAAAAICERSSNHPIAKSVKAAFAQYDTGEELTAYEELSGFGVKATAASGEYYAGNKKLMQQLGMQNLSQPQTAATVLHIVKNNAYLGCVTVADQVKPGVKNAINQLRGLGVESCFMLTGDNEAVAKEVSEKVGLNGFKAGLLPHEKVSAFKEITSGSKGVSLFVGDGINDAPLLAGADIGVAMGGIGSDAAIEAADIVLMTDDIGKLVTAVKTARKTRTIVWQNIIFAMGVKVIVLSVAAFGAVPMWLAIFADVGVALLAVANSTRVIASAKKL